MNAYRKDRLFYVNAATYHLFLEMEKLFRACYDQVKVIISLISEHNKQPLYFYFFEILAERSKSRQTGGGVSGGQLAPVIQ